jgi:hypothetical protein
MRWAFRLRSVLLRHLRTRELGEPFGGPWFRFEDRVGVMMVCRSAVFPCYDQPTSRGSSHRCSRQSDRRAPERYGGHIARRAVARRLPRQRSWRSRRGQQVDERAAGAGGDNGDQRSERLGSAQENSERPRRRWRRSQGAGPRRSLANPRSGSGATLEAVSAIASGSASTWAPVISRSIAS